MEIIKPRETVGGREGEEVVEEKGDCGHREGPRSPTEPHIGLGDMSRCSFRWQDNLSCVPSAAAAVFPN